MDLTDREIDLPTALCRHGRSPLPRGDIFDALWAGDGSTSENVVDSLSPSHLPLADSERSSIMTWTKPVARDYACGMKINMYSAAEDDERRA